MTVIPIVIGVPSTVTKRLVKGLGELEVRAQKEIIQTTAMLISA